MHPVEALTRFGGIASRHQLLRICERTELDRLVRAGDVVRDARGRYALPHADHALRTANRLSGVVSHLSAAHHWGWEIKTLPGLPSVTVPRNRNVERSTRRIAVPHWSDMHTDDVVDGIVTSRARTLTDCMSSLPFDEGLAVVDSALRHDDVTPGRLVTLADTVRGRGAPKARRLARCARAEAANPFESVLRAIALDVPGLDLEPQLVIEEDGFFARPDLVDRERRIVGEADSHTWHSSRAALRRDCRRYSGLVVRGWLVVRFAWEDVMHDQPFVRDILTRLAAQRANPRRSRTRAA